MFVSSTIARHASEKPSATALVFDRETVTWAELETLLGKVARWIDDASPSGKSIALNLPNCPALAVFFLAGARLGREVQILDTQWPEAHTHEIIRQLAPDLFVASHESNFVAEAVPLDFAGLASWLSSENTLAVWPEIDPIAPFYVGFTSGSTGIPKGYRRNHRSWIESFDAAREEFELTPRDIVCAHGTLTHSLYLFALAWAMQVGATCLLSRGFKTTFVIDAASKYRATVMFGVPAQLGMLSRHLQQHAEPCLSDLRWLISSGSKWSSREDSVLRLHARNASFAEFYGASETSFITIARDGENVPKESVGRAFRNVEISIRDNEGECSDTGTDGRIFVKSEMLFDDYATNGGDIARMANGSICVGDIGHLDANGFLFLTGRENRMIVTSGKNLFPEEVERALEQHADIVSAAVLSLVDEKRGERLIGVLLLRDSAKLTGAHVIAHARKHLPLFKVPREYFVARKWPVTRSDKTDFAALRLSLEQGSLERLP